MAKILVKFYTTLKERLNTPKLWLEGGTVEDIMDTLKKAEGKDIRTVLFDEEGVVKNHFIVNLNSRILDHKRLGEAVLKDGDILHIFPPVSGG